MKKMNENQSRRENHEKTHRDQLAAARSHVVKALVALLSVSPGVEIHWTGTKTDLIEVAHIAYDSSSLRDERGRPASFKWITNKVCDTLNVSAPSNPGAYMQSAAKRKGVRQISFIERYRKSLFDDKKSSPIDIWVSKSKDQKQENNEEY